MLCRYRKQQHGQSYCNTTGNIPPGADYKFDDHDKVAFLQMLERKELAHCGKNCVAKLMEDSYERTFFELSLHMKDEHVEWAKIIHTRLKGVN